MITARPLAIAFLLLVASGPLGASAPAPAVAPAAPAAGALAAAATGSTPPVVVAVPAAPAAAMQTAAPAPAAPAEDPALAAARESIAAARAEKKAAYEALEALILDLEDDYEELVSSPRAPSHKHAIVLAVLDGLPQARARLAAEVAQGRPVQRGTRRALLLEAIADPVVASARVDERLARWTAQQLADELSRRDDLDGVDGDAVLRLVESLFAGERSWWQFWNERFRAGLPEVERHRLADEALLAAGEALMRAQYPERYTIRGEAAPAGMVIVPGGGYDLGPNPGWERPARRVELRSFAIDRTEVTCRQYALFVASLALSEAQSMLPRGWYLQDGQVVYEPSLADHPVLFVSLEQAMAYAAWAGKRLPTEDEWEAAAAGIEGRVYPWGNRYAPGLAHADESNTSTMPAGSFPDGRSPVGCHDMAGNVWEWTATDATTNRDIREPPDGLANIVIRGGGFDSPWDEITTRYRKAAPGRDAFGSDLYTRPIGFRCVRDL